jgi:hypothetical protein
MPGPLPFVADGNGACGNDLPSFAEIAGGPDATSVITTGDIEAGQQLRRWSLRTVEVAASQPAPPAPVAASGGAPATSAPYAIDSTSQFGRALRPSSISAP